MKTYDYYTKDELEQKAEHIISRYCERFGFDLLKKPQALDTEHFAEFFMNLAIDYQNLTKDKSVKGCTSFSDGRLEVWNDSRTAKTMVAVREGTILMDSDLLTGNQETRIRFTIAHEVAHQILHRKFYKNSDVYIASFSNGQYTSDQDKHEWQANYLGAALLMPRSMVAKAISDLSFFFSEYLSAEVVNSLADLFCVSKKMMERRLNDLRCQIHPD